MMLNLEMLKGLKVGETVIMVKAKESLVADWLLLLQLLVPFVRQPCQ